MKNHLTGLCLTLLLTQSLAADESPLTGQLVNTLKVSTAQAKGGAAALLSAARQSLGQAQFAPLAAALPELHSLLLSNGTSRHPTASISSRVGDYGLRPHSRTLASQFQQLGLSPGYIELFHRALARYLNNQHHESLARLLNSGLYD